MSLLPWFQVLGPINSVHILRSYMSSTLEEFAWFYNSNQCSLDGDVKFEEC